MASPRIRKVIGDLTVSRSRTALVVLSIAIGVFAVGTMLTELVVVQQAIDDSFDAANPASAVLMTEPFDQEIVEAVHALPDIADAEGRTSLDVRMRTGDGTWHDLALAAIADFDAIQIDRLVPESGAWPPATGEILLERQSMSEAGINAGEAIDLEMPDGVVHSLIVSGEVYDPGMVSPSLSEDLLAGYVSAETLATLGVEPGFNELRVLAAEQPRDLQQGELVAAQARDLVLEPAGITVHRIAVHDTPRYHSEDLGAALFMILTLFGLLMLLLGVFLVINTTNASLAHQTRQIGMMKAIGGTRRQIVALYLATAFGYGVLAVVIAIPLAALTARIFSGYFESLLNIDVRGPWFPSWVLAIELALGLLVPLLAALVPVLRGTRITVREALSSYGLSESPYEAGGIDRLIQHIPSLSRPVLLSLRNTFRRRGRLALTLVTLALGGAIFASIATIQSSLDNTLDEVLQYTAYDVQIDFISPVPAQEVTGLASSVPGVTSTEAWIATNASRVRPDGTQNSNIWLTAPPAGSALITPTLIEGRWLEPGEGEALVVNVDFRADEPDLQLGDLATLRVEGQELEWEIVGIVSTQLTGPVAFAAYEPLSEALEMRGETNRVVLVTDQHDAGTQSAVAAEVDELLRTSGLPVEQVHTFSDLRQGTESLFDVLVAVLVVVSVLLVIVGSLGLMGALALNVIERRRELGLMRAIGASNQIISRIVVTEGVVIGLLGWVFGALLALPMGWLLSNLIGNALLRAPLSHAFSATGILVWLILVLVLSVVASLLPARSAWSLSVRESLAYE